MPRSDKMPGLNSLCTPAYLYFLLSIAMLIFAGIFMNTAMMKSYCVGKCNSLQVILFFLIKLIFIVFWTWILNVLCRGGAGWLSWVMVLFPFVIMVSVFLTLFSDLLFTIGSYSTVPQIFPTNNVVSGPMVGQSNNVAPGPMVGQSQPMLVNGMPAPKMM
jgi:hypothetical protein